MTTPRLRPCLLALTVACLALAAPARADEAARRKMLEKLHPGASQTDDQAPVPAPPLEPPSLGESYPVRPRAEVQAQGPAAEPLPQKPSRAPAAQRPAAARKRLPAYEQPLGLSLTLSMAGGGAVGTGSRYANSRISEVELTVGYDLLDGLVRPELGLLVGIYPNTYVGLRPGLRAFLPDTPLYGRLVLDLAEPAGVMRFRWILAGAGAELRLTDLLGLYAELDAGVPLRHEMGFPVLARAGLTARF